MSWRKPKKEEMQAYFRLNVSGAAPRKLTPNCTIISRVISVGEGTCPNRCSRNSFSIRMSVAYDLTVSGEKLR